MLLKDVTHLDMLIACIRGEAEGESFGGKLAVACVVRNRVKDRRWPDTYKGVILQPHQFESMSGLSSLDTETDIPDEVVKKYFTTHHDRMWWRECKAAAFIVRREWVGDITKGANHFYATSLIDPPYWTEKATMTTAVGGHRFYKL